MTALDFLKRWPCKPWNPAKPDGKWSTSDLIRACANGSVTVNGERIDSKEDIGYAHTLVFFPSSERRTRFVAPSGEYWV